MQRNLNFTWTLFFLFAVTFGTTTARAEIPPDEHDALMALYTATNGVGWTLNTNWGGGNGTECNWFGVTCDGPDNASSTTVTKLNLADNGLNGPLPMTLSNLQGLTELNLANNSLTGSLPSSLGGLTNLQTLSLHTNQFAGEIPSELSSLTNLTNLYLHANQLTGAIPASLGDLANIEYLTLNANKLSGSIPENIIYIVDTLRSIDLRYNAVHSLDSTLITVLSLKHPPVSPPIDMEASQTIDPGDLLVEHSVFDATFSWEVVSYTKHEGGYRVYLSSVTPDVFTQQADIAGKATNRVTVDGLANCTPYRARVHSYTSAHTDGPVSPVDDNNANEVESDGKFSSVVSFKTYGCPALPVVTLPIPTPGISESAITGDYVATLEATDADNDPLYYSITSGNTGNVFAINNSGVISVATALDYETTPSYILSIDVSDGVNTSSVDMKISIINENEPPVLSASVTHPPENIPIGTAVATINATDPDGGTFFTYHIIDGNDAGDFIINSSGVIMVAKPLDFETNKSYTLTIEVNDGGSSATIEVTINVEDFAVDAGGCSLRRGAAFDPVLPLWFCLSLLYLVRKRTSRIHFT